MAEGWLIHKIIYGGAKKMKNLRLTLILFIVTPFLLIPIVGNAQSAEDLIFKAANYMGEDKNEEALELLNEAISIDPTCYNGITYFFRGTIYERWEKQELACNDFKTACGMGEESACDSLSKKCK